MQLLKLDGRTNYCWVARGDVVEMQGGFASGVINILHVVVAIWVVGHSNGTFNGTGESSVGPASGTRR